MNDDNDFKITIGSSDSGWQSTASPYTVSLDNISTCIDDMTDTGSEYTFNVDYDGRRQPSNWPNEYELNDMLELYPALKIAHAKFLEVYNLVKDDYNNQQEANNVF